MTPKFRPGGVRTSTCADSILRIRRAVPGTPPRPAPALPDRSPSQPSASQPSASR